MFKIAVVSGSSSGIGKAISEMLLDQGYKVYGISRSLSSFKGNFIGIEADLIDLENLSKINSIITEDKIDLLVNNAGIAIESEGLNFNERTYNSIFDINFKAPILLTQTLLNKVKGKIVINISSVSDRLVGENYALYCSSKAALNKYFETIAIEEKQTHFFSILPTYVDTPLLRKLQPDNFPWKEILKPTDIANFINKIIENKVNLQSGAKIIMVTESFKEDLQYDENLWGYNTTTDELLEL